MPRKPAAPTAPPSVPRYFTVKRNRDGSERYYWQPSAALRREGFVPRRLEGADRFDAMRACAVINADLAAALGDAPAQAAARPSAAHAADITLAAVIARYQAGARFARLSHRTQLEYRKHLRLLLRWSGDVPVVNIARANVERLYDSLKKPRRAGDPPRATQAGHIIDTLRRVLGTVTDSEAGPLKANPAARMEIAPPPARRQRWSMGAEDAVLAELERAGDASLALGFRLLLATAQRLGDVLGFRVSQWRTGPDRPARQGSLRITQSKTGAVIDVPVIGDLAADIAATIAGNAGRAVPSTWLLVCAETGQRWSTCSFSRRVRIARRAAMDRARQDGDATLLADLDGLELRDTRRSAILRIAEAQIAAAGQADVLTISALSGHRIDYCQKILDTYLPRNSRMAAAAVTHLMAWREREGQDRMRSKQENV